MSSPSGVYAQDVDPARRVAELPDPPEPDAHAPAAPAPAAVARRSEGLWRAEWGRSGWPNAVMIGGSAALVLGHVLLGSNRDRVNRGRNDFDEGARDLLRLHTESERLVFRDTSDVLLTIATSTPVLFDALIMAAWAHEDERTAIELVLIHAEVVGATLALQTFANIVVSRERPYGRTCGGPGPEDYDDDTFFCDSPDRYSSFFSGHTSQSFASAAVLCSFHLNMPLAGDGPENAVVPCVGGFAVAAATGAFRMLSDMHYASDVLTGAAVGTAMGFLIPWLLHFNPRAPGEAGVSIIPNPTGVSMVGLF